LTLGMHLVKGSLKISKHQELDFCTETFIKIHFELGRPGPHLMHSHSSKVQGCLSTTRQAQATTERYKLL